MIEWKDVSSSLLLQFCSKSLHHTCIGYLRQKGALINCLLENKLLVDYDDVY